MKTSEMDGETAFFAVLILLTISIFVITPLDTATSTNTALLDVTRFGVAALIFMIVAKRRASRAAILVTFVAIVVSSSSFVGGTFAYHARPALGLAFDFSVAAIVAATTFRRGPVSNRRILGGIILYLYIGLIFARLFAFADMMNQHAFVSKDSGAPISFAKLLSFSIASLTSVGEARIVVVDPLVESLSHLETVIGQLFPATLLGRLVGLNAGDVLTSRRHPKSPEETAPAS